MKHPPSFTAYQIATRMLAFSRDPEWGHLVSRESVKLTQQCVQEYRERSVEGGSLTRPLRIIAHKVEMAWSDHKTVDGIFKHYAMRKLAVEQQARKAIEEGATQLVMVRAGFDTLFARLKDEYPQVQFFELGHPVTEDIKHAAFAKAGVKQSANFHSIPFDVTKDTLGNALHAQPAYDTTRKTVFIAEGATMYMDKPQVQALLKDMNQLSPKDSTLIMGALGAPFDKDQIHRHSNFESMKFSVGMRDMAAFADENGFRVTAQASYADLQKPIDTQKEQARLGAMQNGENYFILKNLGQDRSDGPAPDLPAAIAPLDVKIPPAPRVPREESWVNRLFAQTPLSLQNTSSPAR